MMQIGGQAIECEMDSDVTYKVVQKENKSDVSNDENAHYLWCGG